MAKKQEVNENQLINDVPAWSLMAFVDRDWIAWRQGPLGDLDYNPTGELDFEDDEEYEEAKEEFPEYDSTIKALELLEEAGIVFDKKTGKWKNK